VKRALANGQLIKTWAMRGALHLLTPDQAATLLPLLSAQRVWERPSWEQRFDMTQERWNALRSTVHEALDGAALTREELAAAVSRRRSLAHLGDLMRSGWGTLLKPLAWQGDICFGPSRANRVTFVRPDAASPRWADLGSPDEAAPVAIAAYFRAYGPATMDAFANWLSGGWFGKRQVRAWFDTLDERLALVDVDGERAYALVEDIPTLAAARPTNAVRLLPAFDQYVLGPGTADSHVVPPSQRPAVSKRSGWISPVVVAGGRVSGTWKLQGDEVRVAWFGGARPPRRALQAEVTRLSSILDRDLRVAVTAQPQVVDQLAT
jgi:Winged helix DNA-binding domain